VEFYCLKDNALVVLPVYQRGKQAGDYFMTTGVFAPLLLQFSSDWNCDHKGSGNSEAIVAECNLDGGTIDFTEFTLIIYAIQRSGQLI